jgi:hypothetical protein
MQGIICIPFKPYVFDRLEQIEQALDRFLGISSLGRDIPVLLIVSLNTASGFMIIEAIFISPILSYVFLAIRLSRLAS